MMMMMISGVARIWCEGGHRSMRRRRRGGKVGRDAPSPLAVGSGENFLNFYIKMVSSGAFWVGISYRLAACFTGIGSTCGVEIYW